MHQYVIGNGRYVIYTDEPLSEEEYKQLDQNADMAIALFAMKSGTVSLPATPENLAKLGG
jgi:hypothetical protein